MENPIRDYLVFKVFPAKHSPGTIREDNGVNSCFLSSHYELSEAPYYYFEEESYTFRYLYSTTTLSEISKTVRCKNRSFIWFMFME